MADGNGRYRSWLVDNLGTVIMVISTIAALAGNWFVMGERIDRLERTVEIQGARGDSRGDAIFTLKSDVRNLDTRLQWLERQTRSFNPPSR